MRKWELQPTLPIKVVLVKTRIFTEHKTELSPLFGDAKLYPSYGRMTAVGGIFIVGGYP